jgi:predicted membrane protein
MRWNVVIGGQLFSKSFLGYTTYKMGLITREGLLVAVALTILPFAILWTLVKILPPWPEKMAGSLSAGASAD